MITTHIDPATAPLLDVHELTALHDQIRQRRTQRQAGAGTILPGRRPTPRRGTGLELMETRPYQHGDDLRHLDWRATARCGKAMTKVFRTEGERNLFVVLDRGPTMAFGTRRTLKVTNAARCTAILVFAAHHQRETVGGMIIDATPTLIAPTRRLDTMWSLVQTATAPLQLDIPATPWNSNAIWSPLAATPSGTTLFVISDFLHLTEQNAKPLCELAQRRRVVALRIWDECEQRLPHAANLHIVDAGGYGVQRIDTRSAPLQTEFARRVQARYSEILELLRGCGITTLSLNDRSDPFTELDAWI